MKPGATTMPAASYVVAASGWSPLDAAAPMTLAMRSPSIATWPTYGALPLPSTIVAFLIR